MNYTIKKINNELGEGYLFLDEYNHCFIIVYGKSKKDILIKYFAGSSGEPLVS